MTGRRVVLTITGAVSAMLIAFTALSAVSWLGRTTETVAIDLDATGVRTIEIHTSAGGVRVVGRDTDRVTGERSATFSLDEPRFTERIDGDVLVLRASCHTFSAGPCDVDYRLEVPRGVALRITDGAGSIDLRDLDGPISASSDAGGVRMSGLSGAVRATSDAGSVRGTAMRSSDIVARSDAGTVSLELLVAPVSVVASSDAGSVTVVVPDDETAYRVDAGSDAGRARVQIRTDPASARRIDATTSAGNVTVRYPSTP